MRMLKQNFTIPEEIAIQLKARIGERKRSAFVAAAIAEKLREIERQQLEQELIEGYKVRSQEDKDINKEWERATLEGWQ